MFDSTGFGLEDLERIGRETEETIQRLADLQEELDGVRGTGTGADGLIGVTANGGGQVERIELNPRVMRLESQTLAEELMKAIDEARADGERRTRELLEAAGLTADPPDFDKVQEQMTMSYEEFARSLENIQVRKPGGH
ncbi:YbaB/EbfC family nucleoid-associated protein [Streptosporangium sp. CA-115845]|uniref:YbaB/EbfC family nucleoid-associated protein n=1 Tax=Streptosporangium sp. CA-115845 TaxID=3240071 RepID=UPI003D9018D1